MKRHKALIPLSHDHHHALKLASAIRKNAPVAKRAKLSNDDKIKDVEITYRTELIPHFKNEEDILFKTAKGKDSELDKMTSEILNEHKLIEKAVKTLRIGDTEENLDLFGKFLEAHIRKEERIVFPKIETTLSEAELDSLIGKIIAVKDSYGI